jgi:hypothetical protein
MQQWHGHAACPCPCCTIISAFHANTCCMFMSNLHAMSMLHVHVHAAYSCPCYLVHVHAPCLCPCSMPMSILHCHVHAECPRPCCMFTSMLHVHVNAPCAGLALLNLISQRPFLYNTLLQFCFVSPKFRRNKSVLRHFVSAKYSFLGEP